MNINLNPSPAANTAGRFAGQPGAGLQLTRPLETGRTVPALHAQAVVRPQGDQPNCRPMNALAQTMKPALKPQPASPRPLIAARARKPLRIQVAPGFAHPVLRGSREFLRALRAAEMAAWEAAHPATSRKPAVPVKPRGARTWPAQQKGLPGAESLLFLVLAGCAATALLQGLVSISNLLTGWSRFTDTIRFLLS